MDASRAAPGGRLLAYALSSVTTLVWVGCVLPAGTLAEGGFGDLATPMHREARLLVPALLLLVVSPAGIVLSQTRVGLLAVLAAMDAFVAFYAAAVLTRWGALDGSTSGALVALLYALGILSLVELGRVLVLGPSVMVSPRYRGLRLAVCILVLLTPSWLLVREGRELASLLAPYALLTITTAGAVLARTATGLRLTAGVLHLALSVHVFVTLRYTIFESGGETRPPIVSVSPVGWATLGLSILVLGLAALQGARLVRRVRAGVEAGAVAPDPVA